jgi:hypothetical protein
MKWKNNSNSQEKAIMRFTNLPFHWSIRDLHITSLKTTRLKMVERGITHVRHDFQARVAQWQQLSPTYASLEWRFRKSHYRLFLRFAIILFFYSATFSGVKYLVKVLALIAMVVGCASDSSLFSLAYGISVLDSWIKIHSNVSPIYSSMEL